MESRQSYRCICDEATGLEAEYFLSQGERNGNLKIIIEIQPNFSAAADFAAVEQ